MAVKSIPNVAARRSLHRVRGSWFILSFLSVLSLAGVGVAQDFILDPSDASTLLGINNFQSTLFGLVNIELVNNGLLDDVYGGDPSSPEFGVPSGESNALDFVNEVVAALNLYDTTASVDIDTPNSWGIPAGFSVTLYNWVDTVSNGDGTYQAAQAPFSLLDRQNDPIPDPLMLVRLVPEPACGLLVVLGASSFLASRRRVFPV